MEENKKFDIQAEILYLKQVVTRLRAEDGCPWDREQTHRSLKPECVEEAAEVIGGINILDRTGNGDNLKEELGDLLLQVVMHAEIAEEEGLFDLADVIHGVAEKMVRRHPHVFGESDAKDEAALKEQWGRIKEQEKKGKEWMEKFLPEAFDESEQLIEAARKRKGLHTADDDKLIHGIHHVSMKCCSAEEYAKMIHFYRDILGLPVRRSWASGIMLDTGNGLLEIFPDGDEPLEKGVIRHFAFTVDDPDACIEAVRKAGYEVLIEPKNIMIASKPEFPARIAFCRGPLGEEIEFFCEK